jgi:hypothetical protein
VRIDEVDARDDAFERDLAAAVEVAEAVMGVCSSYREGSRRRGAPP